MDGSERGRERSWGWNGMCWIKGVFEEACGVRGDMCVSWR